MNNDITNINNKCSGQLNEVWLKAAIVGGSWAAIEIIIGSFLHNLRIPFSGSLLSAFAVILMVSFSLKWKIKGLIWRAGLICALMKSISPSAILLGPMLCIFLEALFMELAISVFGNKWLAYIFGGALSMLSTLTYKSIAILVLYGFNIVTLFEKIFYFASNKLNVQNSNPWLLVLLLIIVYALIGIIAAFIGIAIGKKSQTKQTLHKKYDVELVSNKQPFQINKEQKFFVMLLFSHLIIIILTLFLLNHINLYSNILLVTLYVTFCISHYKGAFKRLKKPMFWLQIFLITILAALFWNGFNFTSGSIDPQGLIIGLKMNLRAILVVIGFSSLSVELRNPVIKDLLFRKGFQNIYLSLSLSFNALPVMMTGIPKPKCFLISPIKSISSIILYADEWLMLIEKSNIDKDNLIMNRKN